MSPSGLVIMRWVNPLPEPVVPVQTMLAPTKRSLAFLVMTAPLLASAAPRAQQLGDLGSTGLQALSYLEKKESAPAGWKQSKLALIESAKKPTGLVRFTVLEPLQQLVNAVPVAGN